MGRTGNVFSKFEVRECRCNVVHDVCSRCSPTLGLSMCTLSYGRNLAHLNPLQQLRTCLSVLSSRLMRTALVVLEQKGRRQAGCPSLKLDLAGLQVLSSALFPS